jgi:hypothetical protein
MPPEGQTAEEQFLQALSDALKKGHEIQAARAEPPLDAPGFGDATRENSLAITRLEEAMFWGMTDLGNKEARL